jgi:type I restriction-modification system DNA methylase subunit
MAQLLLKPHNNHQLFSDYYLDEILLYMSEWEALFEEAAAVQAQIAALLAKYKPSTKEAQVEEEFIKPVLRLLGHTFEVQASVKTADGTKAPDYVFYRDLDALNANKNKKLDDALAQEGAFAVGDAKYWDCPLDVASKQKSGDALSNKNPSYQIYFYVQQSGLAWGILTNGRLWRLYHTHTAHKLDHYYEVDLPALLTADVRQFLYFYAFFRRTAFNQHPLSVHTILQASIDYAQGVGNSLNEQVYSALRLAAQGFIDFPPNEFHPDDPALPEKLDDPAMLKDLYDNSLLFLYRLLFILYAESRNLLPLDDNELYNEFYSLRSMSRDIERTFKAGKRLLSSSGRLYAALKDLFRYINKGEPPLNISTFNGGLFDHHHHYFLEEYAISDAAVQQIIDLLARVEVAGRGKQFVDYRDLSVRNLGTIYEGLLEYHLVRIEPHNGWEVDLLNDKGEARKATGSYYTPDYIVKYMVEQTVGPLLIATVQDAPDDKAKLEAILSIKVLDPSMGSGHFLVEAAEYIARFLVELNVQPEQALAGPRIDLSYWKRRVVQTCIYGVDLNPLTVELAKLSLWLTTVAKDRPLSFLDHHLRTGNAVIGAQLADLSQVSYGSSGRKGKKSEAAKGQLSLFEDTVFQQSVTTAVDLMWLVQEGPAQTVRQVKQQEQLYEMMRQELIGKFGNLADLVVAVQYGVPIDTTLWRPIVDFATGRTDPTAPQFEEWLDEAAMLARSPKHRFFHWELEFPEVFFDKHGQQKGTQAGFDVVIGNPPWIRQEAFSQHKAALASRYRVYHGAADLYTYFVELGNTFIKEHGRFGFILPNKFVRADYGEALRTFLTQQVRIERIVDFGDLPVFPDAVTYPMIILTSKEEPDNTQISYTRLKQLHPAQLAADIASGETQIPRTALTGTGWSLSGAETQTIINKMKAVSVPLGEYVNKKLYRGILTGFNEAFVIDRRTRDHLIAEDPNSAEIIKPFVVGRDVKRYDIDYQDTYIILTKIGTLIERYPAIFAHLKHYQTQLEKRTDQGNHWWELRACDYYSAFEKPKIIFPDIAAECSFAYDNAGMYSTNTTYFMPIEDNQKYLVPILNSSLIEFFFQSISAFIRGDYLRFFTQYVTQIPIRSIAFTTPAEERTSLAQQGIALYTSKQHSALLTLMETCLANMPEQSDVVHDVLVALAESMLALHQQRREALENFMLGLESVLSQTELDKLGRLWTPPNAARANNGNGEESSKKLAEAQEMLGPLAQSNINLHEDISKLNEEQWKWLLKRRLGKPDLVALVKVYRTYQPPLATLDKRIEGTEQVIDQVVYRLYGLTEEERVLVEKQK